MSATDINKDKLLTSRFCAIIYTLSISIKNGGRFAGMLFGKGLIFLTVHSMTWTLHVIEDSGSFFVPVRPITGILMNDALAVFFHENSAVHQFDDKTLFGYYSLTDNAQIARLKIIAKKLISASNERTRSNVAQSFDLIILNLFSLKEYAVSIKEVNNLKGVSSFKVINMPDKGYSRITCVLTEYSDFITIV